jgi:hypothetical protein
VSSPPVAASAVALGLGGLLDTAAAAGELEGVAEAAPGCGFTSAGAVAEAEGARVMAGEGRGLGEAPGMRQSEGATPMLQHQYWVNK